jgi:hypothetical protein
MDEATDHPGAMLAVIYDPSRYLMQTKVLQRFTNSNLLRV